MSAANPFSSIVDLCATLFLIATHRRRPGPNRADQGVVDKPVPCGCTTLDAAVPTSPL